jgi:hypothetical protein
MFCFVVNSELWTDMGFKFCIQFVSLWVSLMRCFHLLKRLSVYEFDDKTKINMSAVFFYYCAYEDQRQFSSQSMTTAFRRAPWDSEPRITVLARVSKFLQSLLKLRRNKRSAYTERPTLPLAEGKAALLSTYMSRREQDLGHRSRQDMKPRMTMLAWTNINWTYRPSPELTHVQKDLFCIKKWAVKYRY